MSYGISGLSGGQGYPSFGLNSKKSSAPSAQAPASGGTLENLGLQLSSTLQQLESLLFAFDGSGGVPKAAAAKNTTAKATPQEALQASGGGPNIVQIDDFSTDETGFNHGKEIAAALNPDGSTNLKQYDLSQAPDRTQAISDALDETIARVQNGEQVDAVELPQNAQSDTPEAKAIRAKIDKLGELGVPVSVAAGNDGPNQKNFLEGTNSFNVENTENGKKSSKSGTGNVQEQGRTTSFASANLALKLARLKSQGLSIDEIGNEVRRQ